MIISIHSLRVEGDTCRRLKFLSTLNFNPLPPRGGRRTYTVGLSADYAISIHSLRVEGDRRDLMPLVRCRDFNPLPPRGGRQFSFAVLVNHLAFQSTPSAWRETLYCHDGAVGICRFQSTPSAWRETAASGCRLLQRQHFNPLPPRGGRPQGTIDDYQIIGISIHSLRVEGDVVMLISDVLPKLFQSTPSAWRETRQASLPCCPILFQSTPSAWRET